MKPDVVLEIVSVSATLHHDLNQVLPFRAEGANATPKNGLADGLQRWLLSGLPKGREQEK